MKKVLVEKCTPQQARVDIKTQLKPANKPNIDIFKIHYDMNGLEIVKNIQVENSSTGINTAIST
jgi:hypothetical protein